MADTATPKLSLILPEVGASADTWGTKTNLNWTTVDDILGTVRDGYLPLAGGNMHGAIVMDNDIRIRWEDFGTGTARDRIYTGPGNNLNLVAGDECTKFVDRLGTYELVKVDNRGCIALFGGYPFPAPVIQTLYATAYASTPRTVREPTGFGNLLLRAGNPPGTPENMGRIQWMHTDGHVYDHIYVGPLSYLNFVAGHPSTGFRWNNVGESAVVAQMDNAGNMTVRTIAQSSDYRLKNIHGVTCNIGYTLDALTVFDAAWKETPDTVQPMLIAHEVQTVCPWAVTGEKDGLDEEGRIAPQSVDYAGMVPMLIAEIQALRRRVATLEARLD